MHHVPKHKAGPGGECEIEIGIICAPSHGPWDSSLKMADRRRLETFSVEEKKGLVGLVQILTNHHPRARLCAFSEICTCSSHRRPKKGWVRMPQAMDPKQS